jgi:Cupin-like domain
MNQFEYTPIERIAKISKEDFIKNYVNFEKFPALKYAKPLYADLSHREMLYMPEGYWHYLKYLSPGFSMSLRSLATKPKNLIEGLSNLFIIRNIDNIMRKKGKQKWIDYRDEKAMKDTNKLIKNIK